jgi:hypothetical protein
MDAVDVPVILEPLPYLVRRVVEGLLEMNLSHDFSLSKLLSASIYGVWQYFNLLLACLALILKLKDQVAENLSE